MDVLSAASSVIAVASLALQLGDMTRKLCNFWKAVKGAPQEIEQIVSDLSIIASLADIIRQEAESPRPHTQLIAINLEALGQCLGSMTDLQNIIMKYQSGISSSSRRAQTWSACKMSWNGEKIGSFRKSVQDAKFTLMLARQESLNFTTNSMHGTYGQALVLLEKMDEKQRHCQDSLTAIDTALRGILVAQTTTATVSTIIQSSDMDRHLTILKERVAAATSVISNPVLRHALQKELASTLPLLVECLAQVSNNDLERNEAVLCNPHKEAISHPPHTKTCTKVLGSFAISSVFGTLCVTTTLATTFVPRKYGSRTLQETKITHTKALLYPAKWLQKFGLSYGVFMRLSLSSFGLECSLKSYRAVPDNAPIFDYCMNGDIKAIQELFDSGLASPWDRDSLGFTPLFVAARYAKVDLCRMLIDQGADINAENSFGSVVTSWACLKVPDNAPTVRCVDRVNTIRLFLKDLGIWDCMNCTGLLGLRRLIDTPCNHQDCIHPPSSLAAFHWLFPQLKDEIDVTLAMVGRGFAVLVSLAMRYTDTTTLERLVSCLDSVNTIEVTKWFSPAHFITPRLADRSYQNSSRFLIRRGLDLHIVADERYAQAVEYEAIRGQTPTTIAMRYSLLWFNYIKLLRDCDTDIPKFVAEELNCTLWKNSEWKQHTLQALFELEFEPESMPEIDCDSDGHRLDPEVWSYGRESSWETFLSRLGKQESVFTNALELLHISRETVEERDTCDPCKICYICQAKQQREGVFTFEAEESPFLFVTS